jgi:TonB family protein
MRLRFCLALLLVAAPLSAQGLVGGVAVDSATGDRLSCVDVTLMDTTGLVVAQGQTNEEGIFQFDAPARGAYRYRFDVWHHAPVVGPVEALDPSSEQARMYQLSFAPAARGKLKLWPDTADSPPGAPRKGTPVPLRYPAQLREKGIPGQVIVHYAVDSAGRVQVPSIRVRKSTDPQFSVAVTDFLRKVQFEPARRDGKPVCALVLYQLFGFDTTR